MAQTTLSQSINFGDGNSNCANIIGSFNTTVYRSDEDAQILCWLSPLEPENRHNGVRTNRFEGVGDWFLETDEFREWRDSEAEADKAVLFCSGNPGAGKTYLSSLVIDSLCDRVGEEDIAVACLYCDYLVQQEQTTTNIMGAILKQLVGGGGIPEDVREVFRRGKKKVGRKPLLADLMRMLRIVIASLPQAFICIDALDEFLPRNLPELLESLRGTVRESPRTRIFLTGRPHVKETIERYFMKAVVIPISPHQDDIKNYLEKRLDRDDEPEAMDNDLREDIVKIILDKMSDIFLLVSLNIEAILEETTIRQRRKKLQKMAQGSGLSDAYTATLTRMKAQKGNRAGLGLKALMWVLHSERPLRDKELCDALGVEIGSPDLDPENAPGIRTLLSSCLGLLAVEASSSTVRFVHFTLQEHLSNDPTLFDSPHSTIAEACLTYLNFGSVRDLSPTLDSPPSTMPLLEYASFYWGEHARRGVTENVRILALRLLDGFGEHISAPLLLRHHWQKMGWGFILPGAVPVPAGFTGLHGAAFLGIVEIVAAGLEMKKWDIRAVDSLWGTALAWAAVGGQEAVVNMLLDREDVSPDLAGAKDGRTPLWAAAKNGYEGIVKMLLERGGVNPDHVDTRGQTPLSMAAMYGHEGVVKILLRRKDVNPNYAELEGGQTPIWLAASGGCEGVVRLLLDREDVNPDHADIEYGATPLWSAARNGNGGVVKLLLEREDVNPNHADAKFGCTPLLAAAKNRREEVVKILLEREGVNPNCADPESGATLLLTAAASGNGDVVKMLLEREDVNPNCIHPKSGATPLLTAAASRYGGIVKMLLEREDVNPNYVHPKSGMTPLLIAVASKHNEVVMILLKREDVNPNYVHPESGVTPLWLAAVSGNGEVVKMLLEREDVDPSSVRPELGTTPLLVAGVCGHGDVVKMLLGRKDVNPNQPEAESGRTLLSLAAKEGREGIIKLLLEREDVNPNYADTECGRTPLSWAALGGHEGAVKMLLGRNDVRPAIPDKENQTPLSLALSGGHDGVARILQEWDNVNSAKANRSS